MDMKVDGKELVEIMEYLNQSKQGLLNSANNLINANKAAGESLEGRQYTLSVEETTASCNIIEAACENIELLINYLSNLKFYLDEYLKCKYEE